MYASVLCTDVDTAGGTTALDAAECAIATMRPLVDEILDNCDGATASAREAGGVAGDIDASVQRLESAVAATVAEMNEIRARADASTGEAVRTRLLGLNARIEAAHAGEHGRGAAVRDDPSTSTLLAEVDEIIRC